MESCFYETIHETDLLHVRFELQDAPAFVFPAHWHSEAAAKISRMADIDCFFSDIVVLRIFYFDKSIYSGFSSVILPSFPLRKSSIRSRAAFS